MNSLLLDEQTNFQTKNFAKPTGFQTILAKADNSLFKTVNWIAVKR